MKEPWVAAYELYVGKEVTKVELRSRQAKLFKAGWDGHRKVCQVMRGLIRDLDEFLEGLRDESEGAG